MPRNPMPKRPPFTLRRLRSGLPPALALLLGVACATAPPPVRTSLPSLAEGDTDARLGYEQPPVQQAATVLPPDLRSGPHHRVDERVATDGFIRTYTIHSDYGELEARGDAMLRTRVAEVEALARLEQLSRGEEWAAALAATARSPFIGAWNLVTDPVDSLLGVPRSAAEALRRTALLARGERGELEDSALSEFFGFEQRKRDVAHRLGVDPYSSNPALQRELNRFAWVSYVGGLPGRFVPFAGDERPPDERTPLAVAREAEILRDYAPEDLRRLNRIELAVMGVPEAESEAFITQPWYSPRHQSVLVANLAALDLVENRQALIAAALAATSEEDAVLYVTTSELLRLYHEQEAPFERIAPFRGGTVVGLTREGTLVAPLPLDYAVWTRPAHAYANTLVRARLSDERRIAGRQVLVTGSLSPKARAKFERRGIVVTELALERLRPDEAPKETPERP